MRITNGLLSSLCILLTCAVLSIGVRAHAVESYSSVPGLMHYQAQLSTADGLNVDGFVSVQLLIYDSADLGAQGDPDDAHVLYAEDHGQVKVDRGVLRLTIGEGMAVGPFAGSPLPMESLAIAPDLYVQLFVDGELISPRQRVAYQDAAVRAQYARKAVEVDGTLRLNANNIPDDLDASQASLDLDPLHAGRIPELQPSKLSGRIHRYRLPTSIPLSKIGSGTLNASVLPDFSASNVIQVGPETFGVSQLPSTVLPRNNVAYEAGFKNHSESMMPIAGYDIDECVWTVAYYNSNASFGIDDAIDKIRVYPGDYSDQTITCELQKGNNTPITCTVQYLMFCKQSD